MTLFIHGTNPTNIFRLNGIDENSASFALGWLLEQSPRFCTLLLKEIFNEPLDLKDVVITLQKHGSDGGYTDIELQAGHRFHTILEAKRGWEVPTINQLKRYLPRLVEGGAQRQRLVSVSAANQTYAQHHLPLKLERIGIVHFSWNNLQKLAQKAYSSATGFEEKLWLRQLIAHLREFVTMERQTDNKVYVVSLGIEPMVSGKSHTWIDVVEKDNCYFHPYGNNWPVNPPNYIGFRYHGRLQSVHHVEGFEIVSNLADYNPDWLKTDSDHFVYRLGKPIRPTREIRTGNIFRSGRVWCAIDTLLSGTFDTISAARDETQRRLEEIS